MRPMSPSWSTAILKELYSYKTDRLLNLSYLQAVLRSYQVTGVNWLWFLYCHGLSGILCDEMGLGKTLQVLTHLLRAKEAGELKEPALVVCPKSVVDVWISEARRFAPSACVRP